MLCRSVYVGKDPATGRYGNFFTHLLFDLPETMDAHTAIKTWEGRSWRQSDGDDFVLELPDVSGVAAGGELNDRMLTACSRSRRLSGFSGSHFPHCSWEMKTIG